MVFFFDDIGDVLSPLHFILFADFRCRFMNHSVMALFRVLRGEEDLTESVYLSTDKSVR